jgi:hypothetical protein
MYKVLSIIFFSFALYTAYFILHTPIANAQGVSLGIYPPVIQIEAQPPASITAPITLENYEETEITLRIALKAFTASDRQNGEVRFLEDNESMRGDPTIFQKVRILENGSSIQELTIGGRQQKKVDLEIKIKEGDPLWDYYFSVIFVSKAELSQAPNSGLGAGIATNVLLSVGPKGEPKGSIEEFSTPLFVEAGPVPFTVRVKNRGDHYLTPTGAILIKNMFGQTIGNVELLPVNILAGTIRAMPDSAQSEENPKPEIRNTKYPVAVWPEKFLLGPYSATITLGLTDKGPVFTKTIHFIAIPVQLVLGIVIGAIIIFMIRQRIKKKFSRIKN